MGKKRDVREVLAENLIRFRKLKGFESGKSLAVASKKRGHEVSQKTINNIEKQRHDAYISSILNLADTLGVEAHQLLLPIEDEAFLYVCSVWAKGNSVQRQVILGGAETAAKMNEDAQQTRSTGPDRR